MNLLLKRLMLITIIIFINQNTNAQFWKKIKKKVQNKVEQKIDDEANKFLNKKINKNKENLNSTSFGAASITHRKVLLCAQP